MKKIEWARLGKIAAVPVIMVVLVLVLLLRRPAEGVDVVNDLEPRWDLTHQRAAATLDSLEVLEKAGASQGQMADLIERNWPTLKTDLMAWLSYQGVIHGEPDSVVLHYGDAHKVRASDGFGQQKDGYFSDQMVAFVYPAGGAEPIKVLVRCLNEYYLLEGGAERGMRRIYTVQPEARFVIGERQGLLHHVDWHTAMMLSSAFDLPLFRGQKQVTKAVVDSARAETLRDSTDVVQLSVRVYAGDEFNLVDMTYTSRGMTRHAKPHAWQRR